MAGVKRKLETGQGPTASPAGGGAAPMGAVPNTPNAVTADNSYVRVTRSSRASRDARAHNMNENINITPSNNNNNRPSRIVTLTFSSRASRANNARQAQNNNARETRTSRARAAATVPVTSHQLDGAASKNVPETPRPKRVRRAPTVEETPRTTRQSSRLKSTIDPPSFEPAPPDAGVETKQLEASPSTAMPPSVRTRNKSRQALDSINDTARSSASTLAAASATTSAATVVKSPSANDTTPEITVDSNPSGTDMPQESNAVEESLKNNASYKDGNKDNRASYFQTGNILKSTEAPSPSKSPRRKSPEPEDKIAANSTSAPSSPNKELKLEDGELDRALEQQLQNGTHSKTDSHSPTEAAVEESNINDESRQITEEVEGSTPENGAESTTSKARSGARGGRVRGRGRGGRSRTAAARVAPNKRGRGVNRTARGGRTGRQHDRSSDVELDRSPSPSAATQKLRDRQRELDKAFRKVAAAQRLALAVLADQSERRLARDRNAHKNVPEFDEVNMLLKARLQEVKETLRREYELRVEQENRLFAANKQAIEERFRASARWIQEEHIVASQGAYMALVEGRRAAEDDEHTETDESDAEPDLGPVTPPTKEVIRGFNSSFVRKPSGAAAYDRANTGWEDFVQRAKLGGDIDPQMKEMREDGPFAGLSANEIISMLVEATGIIEVRRQENDFHPHQFPEVRPIALSALADAATAEIGRSPLSQAGVTSAPRLSTHRTILPQPPQPQIAHGPTDPRAFVLPPPTTQRQQPRRLLPAGQQIPPISEQLGLPDPFATRSGPPQLPPPPGSNFQRPPLPGFLPGHHPPPPPLYYPHPPPPAPGPPPPGPRPPF